MNTATAVASLLRALAPGDAAVFTTGHISREAFAAGDRPTSFYLIGSMGLASALGLGLALRLPDRRVVIVEGDGSVLMSLGSLALIAHEAPANLTHVVLDNGAYASTGGQVSVSRSVNLGTLATAVGYRGVYRAAAASEVEALTARARSEDGPVFLHVIVHETDAPVAPRVTLRPEEMTERFRLALSASPRVGLPT